jgi:hypothetical protein
VAYIAGEDELGRTNISVFLVPAPPTAPVEAPVEPEVIPLATPAADLAATPGAIDISGDLAAATPVAAALP